MDVVLFNQKKSSSVEVMRFQNRSNLNTRKDAGISSCLKACLCCSFGDALPFLQEG